MKIKTKLLSVLGATAIASSSLGLIASCSFKPAPEPEPEEYTEPVISYSGKRIFTTSTEDDKRWVYTIKFDLSRKLLVGESIGFNVVPDSGSDAEVEVTSWLPSGTTLAVNVKFKNVESLNPDVNHIAKFHFTFTSEYKDETHSLGTSEVGDDPFTLNYEADVWDDYELNYTWSTRAFDCMDEGVNVYDLVDDTSNYAFTLDRALDEGVQLTVASTNQYIKASIVEVVGTNVHVRFEIINHTWTKNEEFINIGLQFYFSLNGAKMQQATHDGFSLKYHGLWQTNSATFIGASNQLIAPRPQHEDDEVFVTSDREVKLARKLTESETVTVEVYTKDGSQEHPHISISSSYDWYTSRLLIADFIYTPSETPENDDMLFVLKLSYKDLSGTTRATQFLSANNTEFGRPFEFVYTAPWKQNHARWNGSSKNLAPGDNISSYLIGENDHANEHVVLDRQVVATNQETMKIEITGADADKFVPLEEDTNWSYEKVEISEDVFAYRVKINLMLQDGTYRNDQPKDFYFSLKFTFYENGIQMQEEADVIDNLVFKYTVEESNEIIMPNHIDTKLKTFTFTGSATSPLEDGDRVQSIELWNGSGKTTITLDSWTLGADKKTITFNITIKPVNDYDDEDWNKIQFHAVVVDSAGSTRYEMTTPESFYIHYIHADNPYTEDDLATYISDRSFSVQIYNSSLPKFGYEEDDYDSWGDDEWIASYLDQRDAQTVWILDDATAATDDYTYYVVSTYRFKENMKKIYNKNKNKFVLQIGDKNGAKQYNSGTKKYYGGLNGLNYNLSYSSWSKEYNCNIKVNDTAKNPKGLMLGSTTDYFNDLQFTNSSTGDWIWQNEIQSQTVSGQTMRADMAVAKVDFSKITNKAGTNTYAKAIKAKLDKLNSWRQSNSSIDPTTHKHTINSLLPVRVGSANRNQYKSFCTGGYPIGIYFNESSASNCKPYKYETAESSNPKVDAYYNNVHIAESTLDSENSLWYSSSDHNNFGSFYDHTAQESWENVYSSKRGGSGDMDYYPNNPGWSKFTHEHYSNTVNFLEADYLTGSIYHSCSSQYTPINGYRSSFADGSTQNYEPKLGYGARGSMAVIRKKDASDPRIYVVCTFTNIYEDTGRWWYFWPTFDGYLTDSNVNILRSWIGQV